MHPPDTISSYLREYVVANKDSWNATLMRLWGMDEASLPTNTVADHVRAAKDYSGMVRLLIIPCKPIDELPLLYNQKAYSYIQHSEKFKNEHPYKVWLEQTSLLPRNIENVAESIRKRWLGTYTFNKIDIEVIPAGKYTYVYMTNGNVVLCRTDAFGTGDCKHTGLVPPWWPVTFAGEVMIVEDDDELTFAFNAESGTYAPSSEGIQYIIDAFDVSAQENGFPFVAIKWDI